MVRKGRRLESFRLGKEAHGKVGLRHQNPWDLGSRGLEVEPRPCPDF